MIILLYFLDYQLNLLIYLNYYKNYLIVGYRDKSSDMLAFVDLTNFSVKEFYFFGDGYYFKQINNEIHIKNIYENCYNIDFKLIILDNEIIKEPIEKKQNIALYGCFIE